MSPYKIINTILLFLFSVFPLYSEDYVLPIDTVHLFNRISGMDEKNILDLADSAFRVGDNAKAMSLYMALSGFSRSDADSASVRIRVRAYRGVGDILAKKGNYAAALDYYIKGLKLSESVIGHPLASTFYKNIGNVYVVFNDYEKGIFYYNLGLEECAKTPDLEQERKILINAAIISSFLGKKDDGKRFMERAFKVNLPVDNELKYMNLLLEGTFYEHSEEYEKALDVFLKLRDFALENKVEPRYVCSVWEHLYFIYDRLNMPDSTFKYLKRCEKEVLENNMINDFSGMLRAMSEFYEERGDMALSQKYKLRYIDVRDSISSERQFNAVKNIQFQYETEKIAEKIDSLIRQKEEKESTIRTQSGILYVVLAVTFVLCAFFMFIYKQKKRLSSSYRSLYEINRSYIDRQEQLEKQISEVTQVIIRQKKEIEQLKSVTDSEVEIIDDVTEADVSAGDSQASAKYSSSNLNDSLRMKLANDIAEVMNVKMVYCDPDFSLDMLAELVGSNTKYVSQTINMAYDKNFSNYVNDYRIKLAVKRLVDAEYASYTVKAIGESVGFKSQSAFTAVFRKHTGLTPSMYQKMSKSE